jgi:proteasome lid subunit RPN8/RPN11
VKLSRQALEALTAHVLEGYPFEACGVLVGRESAGAAQVEEAVRMLNREAEQPRVRYQIAPEDLLRLQREVLASGRDILGFYHSHPDHPARPSETDRRVAAGGLSDGVIHMVIGVQGGTQTTPSAWIFRDTLQGFEPEPLEIGD